MKHDCPSIAAVIKTSSYFSSSLLLAPGLFFFSFLFSHSSQAQGIVEGPIMLTGEHETGCLTGGISGNGRYIFGLNPDNSFRYNLETKESYYPPEQHQIVSVFDNGDMLIFVVKGNGGVITEADNKFTAFTSPDSEYPFMGPMFASADGKYICGNVAKEKGGFLHSNLLLEYGKKMARTSFPS